MELFKILDPKKREGEENSQGSKDDSSGDSQPKAQPPRPTEWSGDEVALFERLAKDYTPGTSRAEYVRTVQRYFPGRAAEALETRLYCWLRAQELKYPGTYEPSKTQQSALPAAIGGGTAMERTVEIPASPNTVIPVRPDSVRLAETTEQSLAASAQEQPRTTEVLEHSPVADLETAIGQLGQQTERLQSMVSGLAQKLRDAEKAGPQLRDAEGVIQRVLKMLMEDDLRQAKLTLASYRPVSK